MSANVTSINTAMAGSVCPRHQRVPLVAAPLVRLPTLASQMAATSYARFRRNGLTQV
jgi:hypothetical protein